MICSPGELLLHNECNYGFRIVYVVWIVDFVVIIAIKLYFYLFGLSCTDNKGKK